ncbi:MAG: molybdopterin-dependent oxidoreductase [Terriglobales bacterium]
MKKPIFCSVLLVLMLDAALVQSQQLTIQIEAQKPVVLTRAAIEALPRIEVKTGAPDAPVTFAGVSLRLLLEKAGVSFGESLRGKRLASCLLIDAADGYRVVIALPEIDPAFTDRQFVLAFLRNGKPLDEKEGPYRIVIPDEKRMARWVKRVTTLRIVDPE